MKGRLPGFFKFKPAKDLIRIGRSHDGGYLACRNDVYQTNVLVGLGICDDWSFESDFTKLKDVPVKAYDASVDFGFWAKQSTVEFLKNPLSLYAFRKLLSYHQFFRGNKKHIKKFVGLNSRNEAYCTLDSVLKEVNDDAIFLKIDVEGSEYRFLDTLIEHQAQITGLVIEFHDCDLHLEQIQKFIEKFALNLVHIHANNYSPLRKDDDLPLVLELTFSRNGELCECGKLPHSLDMPNDKFEDEINLVIEE